MADKSQSFRDVIVWQKAHAFALAIYRCTEAFPKHELFVLTSQLRRAAASVPANIVEGFRKRTKPDKLRFYNLAQGSADECLYQLILATISDTRTRRCSKQTSKRYPVCFRAT